MKIPIGATRGEKYQAGATYDNDLQGMRRMLEAKLDISLGRVCQHYKVFPDGDGEGDGDADGDE